jgi:uncharacterized membrane protein YfcA
VTLEEALHAAAHGAVDQRIFLLVLVMVGAGFVSGLAGFGFSFIAAPGLFLFAPRELFPLLLLISLMTQVVSIWSLRASMVPIRRWWPDGPLPFVVGAALGVPGGLWLLYNLDAETLSELVGIVILGYAAWSLFAPPRKIAALLATPARVLTGILGGVVGGFTAAPGSVVAIWGTLTGIAKERQRAILQPFIVCTQLFTLIQQVFQPGGIPLPILVFAAALAPVVIPANLIGVRLFRRIDDAAFKKIVLLLLIGMAIALIDRGFHVWGDLYMVWHSGHRNAA